MTRRILMAESVLGLALLAVAQAERARVRRVGAYVVVDTPEAPSTPAVPKVGRNEPCPCGSGTKFKKCCLR